MTEKDNRPLSQSERSVIKDAMKEAMKEWLDEKFAAFGRWSFYGFMAALFTAFTYFIMASTGWVRP